MFPWDKLPNNDMIKEMLSNVSSGQIDKYVQQMVVAEIRALTEGTWAPWTYHNEEDVLVGFDVEVAQKIAEKLGVTVDFE